MRDLIWLRELVVTLATLAATAVPAGMLAPVVSAPVPDPPVVAPAAGPGDRELFFDDFDAATTGPLEHRWHHQSSSTPERTELTRVDGRSVLRVRPEGNLMSHEPVPFRVGTTYRVSAAIRMPTRAGTHPAFWLRSHHPDRVGEIDVVESWGGTGRCRVQVAFYWRYFPAAGPRRCASGAYPEDMSGWHEYAAEFTYAGPGQDPGTALAAPTRFLVDGRETWSAPHSPVAPEYLRLQHKRNCPDEEQPDCGQDAEHPSMYVDWVRVEVVGRDVPQPTVPVHAVGPDPTGSLRLRTLDPASGRLGPGARLPLGRHAWRFEAGDFDGDRVADLYAVDTSGRVHVLDGASGFRSFALHAPVAEEVDLAAGSGVELRVGDANGDGRADLYAIDTDDRGRTSVVVLDARSGFQTVLTSAVTPWPALDPRRWRFAVGDHDDDGLGDLHAVDLGGASEGSVAVHVLDRASDFQQVLTRTTVALPSTAAATSTVPPAGWTVRVSDVDGDGRADLRVFAHPDDGGTAVHVLAAEGGFTRPAAGHTAAPAATGGRGWQLF